MLKQHLELNNLGGEFAALKQQIREGVPCSAFGLQFSEKCHIAGCLNEPVLYIAPNALTAERAATEIRQLTGEEVAYLCAKDEVLLYKKAFNKESMYKRLTALNQLSCGVRLAVTTMQALLQLFPDKVESIVLKKGDSYDFQNLGKKLLDLGYRRLEFADGKGSFAFRGDILDIYPINGENAYRIDFFGDEIENIRIIDLTANSGGESVDSIKIITASDCLIDNNEVNRLQTDLKNSFFSSGTPLSKVRSRVIVDEIIQSLDCDLFSDNLQFLFPLISAKTDNVFDYLPEDTVIVFDECKLVGDGLEMLLKEHFERCDRLIGSGEALSFTVKQYSDGDLLLKRLRAKRCLALQTLTTKATLFNPLYTCKLNVGAVPRYTMHIDALYTDLKNWLRTGYRVIICGSTERRAQSLADELGENKIFCGYKNEFKVDFMGVMVTTYTLESGFILHDSKLVVIGSGDLFLKSGGEKKISKRRGEMFSAPVTGDYAVHEVYGIGVVRGTKIIESVSGKREYVSVEYSGGDMLYVPVDSLDKLTRYLGGENKPTLNRLGTKDFERVLNRVKNSVAAMKINLKELYRERAMQKGFEFSPDDDMMRLFEEAFPYEETEDQISTIAEIKSDMESTKVMDRLICGDVGFGKTEVALRAAFKAILDGKQVALIAPTTILTQQHFTTCIDRFHGFGVRMGLLNRFRTAGEQNETLKKLAAGEIDLIIGTHRLFGKDIRFKDLGLLILDEEQRFGVEHKEKIKLYKKNVNTLTLTATPIPRTLHMSLTGIRDISTINTPPKTRIPVQTYVVEQSDGLIRDAIIREIARDGQVFVLFNRVDRIYAFAKTVSDLVPDAKVLVAHGQMEERKLEENIMRFYDGEFNVLVTTTIIENGIDLPNANTLIVIDADRLGISTLYQLKGRVGRSDRMAHAYFTFASDKVLTDSAYKRLSAIMEFSEMGSGFKLAMRDLEIRGAGNVMGKEQHGHMEKVGYELYSKILREQLDDEQTFETELNISANAYIPSDYIGGSSSRMDVYKQIAELKDKDDMERIIGKLKEVFGTPPDSVTNLLNIAYFKLLVKKIGCVKAVIGKDRSALELYSIKALDNESLHYLLEKHKKRLTLAITDKPIIKRQGDKFDPAEEVKLFTRMLEDAESQTAS